jgi:hypothetical protein
MTDYKVNIEINSEVSEIFAKTIVTQKFKNPESNPLELKIYVYKKENIIFSSFSAQIGDSIKVKSKVIKKEKAEEKYNDAVSSGNAAIYVYEDEYYNRIVINMGYIPPNEKVIFISEFIQLTESSKSYEFELFRNLPIFIGKNLTFQNGNLKGKVEIKTKNKIIKLEKEILMKNLEIIKEENKYEEQIYNYLIEYQILELSKFKENDRNFYNDNSDYISSSKIYFYTEENKNNCPFIYCQKSDLFKNEKSYIISYKNNQKTDNLKINPALFIFLIDQSGSMSGSAINIVSKALELFLQSIPVGSYYQLIGFGSDFKKYDESPKSYTKENITNSIKIIKNLKADLGGTDIYQPLKNIYENNNIYNEIKLPKNIFLLTDGEIENKKETLELIEKYSSEFSIFSIGIGNSFDKDLIKNSGIIGKGGFNFCPNLEGLNSIIINEIDKCVSSYISNFNMKSSLDEKHLYKTFNIPEIVRNNQIINLGYIIEDDSNKKDNKIKIDLEYFEDGNKKKNYEINPEIIKDGNELSKLIINNYLDNDLSEKEKEKLALKYQLLTKYTSLFAEIELSDQISDEMKTKIIGEKNYYNINNRNDEIKIKIDESLENIDFCCMKVESNLYCMKEVSCCRKQVEYSKKCKKKNSFNIFSSIFLCCKKKRKIEYKNDVEKVSNEEIKNTEKKIINKFENDIESDYINSNIKINDNEINSNNNNKLSKNELMKIINTQDFIEGFWEYNDNTKFLKEKYEKEYEILKKDKNINCNEKIILTILMIYFIEKNYSELLNELSFVIKKGKIFINKETKSNYEELIKLI